MIELGCKSKKINMKHKLIFILFLFCKFTTSAQISFQKVYDFTGVVAESANGVQQTIDGGYIINGLIYPPTSDSQLSLIKTNQFGDTTWSKAIGGIEGFYTGNAVQQTTDSGYIATGMYRAGGVYLVKTNSLGDTLWTKHYAVGSIGTQGNSIQQTTDEGYIIAGTIAESNNKMYVLKTDALGDTLWTKIYGGANSDEAYFVRQTTDGGYIIAGETWSFGAGSTDAYLIKTNALGDTVWTKTYGTTNGDGAREVRQTTDGGYIICGYSNGDMKIIKTNSIGTQLWQRTVGGISADFANSIKQTNDGGYIVTGRIQRFDSGNGIWLDEAHLIKLNSNGTVKWNKNFGNIGKEGFSVQQTTDKGYIITGTSYQIFLIKTDSMGVLSTTGFSNNTMQKNEMLIYPNPSKDKCYIEFSDKNIGQVQLKIFNENGQEVWNKKTENNFQETTVDISKLAEGLYFIIATTDEQKIYTQKIIISK
jgi:hypothetical protein